MSALTKLILAALSAAATVLAVAALDRALARAVKRGDDEWRNRW